MTTSGVIINVWTTPAAASPPVPDNGIDSPPTLEVTPLLAPSADVPEALPEKGSEADFCQNVTMEENDNSFVKQLGRFTLHQNGADEGDRVAGASGRAYALVMDVGFVVGGEASHGGSIAPDLKGYLGRNPPLRIFSTEKNFAALVGIGESNRLIVWGGAMAASNISYSLSGIRSVYANRYAFAFIYEGLSPPGQRIGAIGDVTKGGLIPDDLQLKLATDEPASMRATESAFAVLTRSGKVYAWGDANGGGKIDGSTAAVLDGTPIAKIFASSYAFCAVGKNNQPIAWGHATQGGSIPAAVLEAILDDDGVHTIVAAQAAFCCITRRRRKAVAWGSAGHGGTMHASAATLASLGDIAACKAAAWAFCIINQRGQAEAWGHAHHGGIFPLPGDTGIQSAGESSSGASGGDIRQEIGDLLSGGAMEASPPAPFVTASFTTSDWTAHLHAVDSGFCLVTAYTNGLIRSVTSWGASDTNVSDTVRQVLLGSHLQAIITSNRAYLAVVRQGLTDGCAVTWGEPTKNGGLIPDDVQRHLQGGVARAIPLNNMPGLVTTASSTNVSGFLVTASDGSAAVWGGAAATILLDP
jgi:hypothetical protein